MASTFPNIRDNLKPFLDVTSADSVALTNFEQAMRDGKFDKASEILATIQNSDQKLLTADKFNLLRDCYIQLTDFYTTDIKPYITLKQTEWQGIIDQFSFLSNYDSTLQYVKNNMVLYKQQIYLCIAKPPNINVPPTNLTYWRLFTVQGVQGDSGGGINTTFMFAWDFQYAYKVNMIVFYENQWWLSLKDNVGQTPQESEFWTLVLTVEQTHIPIQPNEPLNLTTNDLWFKTI